MDERKREESAEGEGPPVPQIRAGAEDRNLAGNVRDLRERLGISQGELARRMADLGWPWHQQTTRRVEDGSRKVSAGEAAALARILGTSVTRLMMAGRQASLAYLLDSFTGRAHEAYGQVAAWTAQLQAARGHLARTAREAKASPWATAPEMAALIREAAAACGLDPQDAVTEGLEDAAPGGGDAG